MTEKQALVRTLRAKSTAFPEALQDDGLDHWVGIREGLLEPTIKVDDPQ